VTDLRVVEPGAARSFWLQEALAHDAGDPCPPLDTNVAADVCIVGGGFAGLWTAIELTEREPGLRVTMLEQDIVGGGASGRNGGFFSSSWWDLPGLCGLFGEDGGLRYARVLADSVSRADAFVREHGIDCWFHLEGTLAARAGAWQGGIAEDEAVEFYARLGEAGRMRPLTGAEAREYADSPRFTGGVFVPDNAICQPARLARGLRRVLLERGVRIFERTKVIGVERSRPAVVRAEHGAVRADQVVLAHGSWAASCPGFRRSFGVIVDTMVVTEPVPDRLREIGWRSNVGVGDGRDLLYYLRPTEDGRIAIGGGATGVVFGGRASGRAVTRDRHAARVAARGLLWLFPQLEGVRFTHAWGGPIDHTASFVPFYRTLRPGNLHAGLGFSGHGLSQTSVGGRILASKVLGVEDEWTALPVDRPEIGKVPPEPFRWPAVKAAAWALERGDAREERGRPRGTLYRLIGGAPTRYRRHLMRRGLGADGAITRPAGATGPAGT
jgi:glycine/D-amino acid oxidase-like deaminating enzyme